MLTVEEYKLIPDPPGGTYELRGGALVKVPFPLFANGEIAHRLCGFLGDRFEAYGETRTRFAFRPIPEHELRSANVALIERTRFSEADPLHYLSGAPDLMVEVLPPSGAANEIESKATLCLANGTKAFWMVDPMRRTVTIRHKDSRVEHFAETDTIEIDMFGTKAKLRVSDIFQGL